MTQAYLCLAMRKLRPAQPRAGQTLHSLHCVEDVGVVADNHEHALAEDHVAVQDCEQVEDAVCAALRARRAGECVSSEAQLRKLQSVWLVT